MALDVKTIGFSNTIRTDHAQRFAATALGLFFLATALLKANSPVSALFSVRLLLVKSLGLDPAIPRTQSVAFATMAAIVAFEIILGALLLADWKRRAMVIVTLTTLIVFSVGLIALVADPESPSCGCLGAISFTNSARAENLLGLGRNALLAAVCAWLLIPHKKMKLE